MKELDYINSLLKKNGLLDEDSTMALYEIEKQLTLCNKLLETLYNSELYLVYIHTTPNGKKYIGITKDLPNTRWNEGAGYESQKKFYKAIQADGWKNIKHQIVAAGLTENEAKELETKLIIQFNTIDPQYGYNTNLSVAEDSKAQSGKNARSKSQEKDKRNDLDICRQIVEKHSIKTVDKTMYLSNGSEYSEASDSFIEKELLEEHQIVSKKQRKDIIDSIKILSQAQVEDVFPEIALTAQEKETQILLDAFTFCGFKRVTAKDISDLITWLNETDEKRICIPMIWDRVFHLSERKCPPMLSKRLGQAIRNNGWVPGGKRRFPGKYGTQHTFVRGV